MKDDSFYNFTTITRATNQSYHRAVSGGCINSCYQLTTSTGLYFLKWNDAKKHPKMFEAEAKGLNILREKSSFTLPNVIATGETSSQAWLLLEYISQQKPASTYWVNFGEKLAELHQNTQPNFGLSYNNYIGSIPQNNLPMERGYDFFINHRILPVLNTAIATGKMELGTASLFEKLFMKLPDLLPDEPPALLHGDLWSGNQQPDGSGNPCVFDPAVYYGFREAEIAFTHLFGGFNTSFYESYHHSYPLLPNFKERIPIYNLYPLLVHVNLFGGGYAQQVQQIIHAYR